MLKTSRFPKHSVEELRQVLEYNPATGIFTWKADRKNAMRVGTIAGTLDAGGRRRITHESRQYYAAWIAWAFMTGEWPVATVDHRNRVRGDDRWDNLRTATRHQNVGNSSRYTGKDLPKGVSRARDRYVARIRKGKVPHHLGTFDTIAEAAAAYMVAAKEYWGEFAIDDAAQ